MTLTSTLKTLLGTSALLCLSHVTFAAAVVNLTLTDQGSLPANDDGSSATAIALNIGGAGGVNFFGTSFTDVWVNNNGNVTFGNALSQYTPNGLATGVGQPIIAPYFADVDTRGLGSGLTTYGNSTYNGHAAFVVDWPNVGYYSGHVDKLADFQLILTDRSDVHAGDFDVEFNYNTMQWETGDASGGNNGLGGTSAAVGYSNGLSGTHNIYYQLAGSLVNGALIDGGPDALISHDLNSDVPGRYDFQVRNGSIVPPTGTPEPLSFGLLACGILPILWARRRSRRESQSDPRA